MKNISKTLLGIIFSLVLGGAAFVLGMSIGKNEAETRCIRLAQELSARLLAATEPMIEQRFSPRFTEMKEGLQSLEMSPARDYTKNRVHWFADAINFVGKIRSN